MADGRSKLILLSVAVAESAWLFALFSTLGLIGSLGGSPLPWLSLLSLLLLSIGTGYVLGAIEGDEVSTAIKQSFFGLFVIYLVLGTGTFLGGGAFDAGWIFKLFGGELSPAAGVSAGFGFLISIWIWRHGVRLGTDRYPEDRLARIFRIGIGVLALATLIDQASSEDIGAGPLLVPFFGATLVGMAVGRLPEGGVGKKAGEWARIIGVSVFAIMGLGLLIGLIGGLYGNGGVKLLYSGWGLLVDGILWILRFPVTWATAVLQWLIDLFGKDGEERPQQVLGGGIGQEIIGREGEQVAESGNSLIDTIVNILQYPAIVLLVIVAFFLLAMAFRKFGARDGDDDDEERESIRSELDTEGDMARLLGGLVPGWWRRKRGRIWKYPAEAGFAEVFKLYFDSIRLGVKWGMEFQPHMTPAERLPLMESALPGAPVGEVTDRFNAACYGRVPTDPETVNELRLRVEAAETALRRR